MKVLDSTQTLQALAKALGKPCMLVSFELERGEGRILPSIAEIEKAAPYLSISKYPQAFLQGGALLVFGSDEEMFTAFNQTVGDDGPTETNPYKGPGNVYALTCTADGKLHGENT